jgi:hypothetical protein
MKSLPGARFIATRDGLNKWGYAFMFDPKLVPLGKLVTSTRELAKTGPHLRLELRQLMSRLRPDDLSAAEIAGLLAILVPAHARIIGGPAGRPGLRILRTAGEHAAPKLAQ